MDILDLSGVSPIDTIQYEILKPGGVDGTGWVWEILSASHAKAVAFDDDRQRRNARRERQEAQQRANGKKVIVEDRSVEDQKHDTALFFASRVGGWNRTVMLPEISPEPLTYSDENVVKILLSPKMDWIYKQVLEVVTAETSFTKTSAKT